MNEKKGKVTKSQSNRVGEKGKVVRLSPRVFRHIEKEARPFESVSQVIDRLLGIS